MRVIFAVVLVLVVTMLGARVSLAAPCDDSNCLKKEASYAPVSQPLDNPTPPKASGWTHIADPCGGANC